MTDPPAKINLATWDQRYPQLQARGVITPSDGGPLGRHLAQHSHLRLQQLDFDNSPAALRLWNLVLSEETRLREHRAAGRRLVGTMKDLGTVPVIANSSPDLVAFYPDGAWWTPCLMQGSDHLLEHATRFGIGESFCPARAVLGAFITGSHFPSPDLLICSVGAICDDFSAIAQRIESLGHPILWWEIPRRRPPDPNEEAVILPGGLPAPASLVAFVRAELERLRRALSRLARHPLDDSALHNGIRQANEVRRRIRHLRQLVHHAPACPLPALEMLMVDALALHFCSDRAETLAVLDSLIAETERRVAARQGVLSPNAIRLFWVNPVADLRVLNLLETLGGRIAGSDYLFGHASVEIPENLPPLEALARVALADVMVGPTQNRAQSIASVIQRHQLQGLILSRVPGASHCAWEGAAIRDAVANPLGLPTLEIEVPPIADSLDSILTNRIQALLETIRNRKYP
jgi:hypothetical protein